MLWQKFPRNVLYCPNLYKGMKIQHPYYKQGLQETITCIHGSTIGSQKGTLIKFLAEEFMLKKGMLLTLGTVKWDFVGSYVTPSWFGRLAEFVSAQELDIKDNFDKIKLHYATFY